MKKLVLAVAGLSLFSFSQADVISQWDFNTYDGNALTGTTNPAIGTGIFSPIGGVTNFYGFGVGSTDPQPSNENSDYGIGDLPAQGTGSGTAGWEVRTDTTGFSNISFALDTRTQFSSSKYWQVQYQTSGGGSWVEALTYGVAQEDVWETQMVNLSALDSAVENNSDLGIRVVAVFKPGESFYASMNDVAAGYGGFGHRTDMVTFSGEPVPEPSVLLLLGLGGLFLKRKMLRKENS